MKILHVNDVASVGSILVRASRGRDVLFQPRLRRHYAPGRAGGARFAAARLGDAARLARALGQGDYSHLHVHYATFAALAELARAPYSLHVHGADVLLDPYVGGLKARLALRGIARATAVVVSTPDLLGPTRRLRADAVYLPNPMELPASSAPPAAGPRPRALLLSKMDPLKGWDRQLELAEAVVRALPELELHYFEHGQLPDPERARLSRRLVALGARPQPRLPREGFLAALGSYDFALGQLEVGSLGMSELEAMARAVPTVADARAHEAVGLTPAVVRPAGAPEALAALWRDPSARRAQGLAGRDYVRAVHDPDRALRDLERCLAQSL